MSSLQQGASILAERAGKKSDTSFLREMKDLIVVTRARIMANSLGKNPAMDKFYLQSFRVPLKKVDKEDECNTDLEGMCCDEIVWRSVDKIPEPLKYGVHPFNYVGSPGGAKAYGWTTFGTERYLKEQPLIGKLPRVAWRNSYIYVFNKEMEFVDVEGVFGDPRQVAKFKCCDASGKSCYSDEQEFPVDEQNMQIIIAMIITDVLRLNLPNDKTELKVDHNE